MACVRGRGPGRERVVVPPDARSRPPQTLPFLWGTSRQVVGLSGRGLSCADLTNPSLTHHSSGTWPRQGHPPSSPDTRLSCRGLFFRASLLRPPPPPPPPILDCRFGAFVVEPRSSARPFPFGRRSRKVWERRRLSLISRGRRSTPVARASLKLLVRAAAKSWCTTARLCPWQARRD